LRGKEKKSLEAKLIEFILKNEYFQTFSTKKNVQIFFDFVYLSNLMNIDETVIEKRYDSKYHKLY